MFSISGRCSYSHILFNTSVDLSRFFFVMINTLTLKLQASIRVRRNRVLILSLIILILPKRLL